jgi:ribosomal protein L11 methyltransferase
MLELFPEGFAEERLADGVELVAFTDEAGAERLRGAFGAVKSSRVASGWEEEWKRFHVPVRIGPLWIGPPWTQPEPGSVPVLIDPGRAFGTGAHPTTQLCLELLRPLERGSLLDVGCGSGVLAIAATKLGFEPVTAIDTDDAAIEATRRNAALNMLELDVRRSDALTTALPDAAIVVANIDLVTLGGLIPPGACRSLVTSGYYAADERPSFDGYEPIVRETRVGWVADLFRRE